MGPQHMTAAAAPKLIIGIATRYRRAAPEDGGDTGQMKGTRHLKATLFICQTYIGAGISG